MYTLFIRDNVHKMFKKMQGKDKRKLGIIKTRIDRIQRNPYSAKTLRPPLQNLRRVHVDKSFVIIYSIDEAKKKVVIEDYNHHDNIYEQRV